MTDKVNYTKGESLSIDLLKDSFLSVRINENLSFIYGEIHKVERNDDEQKTRIHYGSFVPISNMEFNGDWIKDDGYVVVDYDTTVAWANQEYLDNLVELG